MCLSVAQPRSHASILFIYFLVVCLLVNVCLRVCAQEESLDVGSMSKTPPNRRGITFEVGAQLEARDSLKNW